MPFRFHCSNCHQRLSVSSHKRGQDVKCPRCRRVVRVPADVGNDALGNAEGAATEVTSFPAVPAHGDLTYAEHASANESAQTGLRQSVSIPRYVLYTQGFLLGAVALAFFVFGLIVGSRSRGEGTTFGPQNPVTISGTILVDRQGNSPVPDAGSVIMLLPASQRPDEKASAAGLCPEDTPLEEEHPALAMLRRLGGDYARADRRGRYQVRAAVPGRYYLLVISKRRRRAQDRSPGATELARLGRFVLPATQLLGQHSYRWKEVLLRNDQQFNVTF